MKRREFIRLGGFLTVSAAAMSMTGCDIVGDNNNTSTSAIDPDLYPNPVRPMPAAATGANWYFPQSVASGDPKADSIILWTRLLNTGAASATAEATLDASIQLKVTAVDNSASLGSNTALSGTLVADVEVPAYADFDGTVRHKLTGLSANTVYYYQFVAGTVLSKVGRFKTAPAADATSAVKFAVLTCQDWSANHWGVFNQIVADDSAPATPNLDFLVHLGDYIYETDNAGVAGLEAGHGVITFPNGTDIPPERTTGTPAAIDPPGKYATTRADYRYLYKLYRSDARLQAVHERFPMVAVWDDHEFSDDAWMDAETYTNKNSPQLSRRRDANQAWFEYMPADVTFQELNPSFQNIQLYRDLKFGTVMHLVMTDERLYRQDHMIPESTPYPGSTTGQELGRINSRYLAPEGSMKLVEQIKEAASADMTLISMLGATQRNWWKSTMANSTATWKIWGNEVSLLRMGLNGSKAIGTLVGLQTVSGTAALMTSKLSDTSVQGFAKIAAGAAAAVGAGATSTVAVTGSFAIAQTYAGTGGDATAAVNAGVAAGMTAGQASASLTAIGGKTPSPAEVGISATTVVAAAQAYMTTNLSQANAQLAAAGATVAAMMLDVLYSNAAPDAALLAALKSSYLNDTLGNVVLNVYKAAKANAAGSQVAPAATAFAAGSVMFLAIRAEVETYKATSSYVAASGQAAALSAFLRKFIINADQWDGYRKERADLMNFLTTNSIQNVVAVTGDIHAFFAGTVHSEFAGEILTVDAQGGELTAASASTSPAMVDLVTAGASSTSWFNYLSQAAAALSSSLLTLVKYTITGASTGLPFDIVLPVLDFSLGKVANATNIYNMVYDAIIDASSAAGVPLANLNAALSATAYGNIVGLATGIASNPSLQGLCGALSLMGTETNPWLAHVDSNAQGYSVVNVTSSNVVCEFRRVNVAFVNTGTGYRPGLLGGSTDARPIVARTTTATVTAGTAAVVIS